ncbi:hypothetical protein [Pseudodesulfovibrio sp.]|uniref:hypothetical protein n=1 Tax=unclassified Pseudodesulfovibrio TaxID=2661612 RepID=UPI003AFFE94C
MTDRKEPRKLPRLLTPILHRDTILAAFVLSPLLNGAVAMLAGTPDWPFAWGSVAIFAVLAWLTRQGWGLASWATVLLLLYAGTNQLYYGLNGLVHKSQLPGWLLPILVVTGAYLTWGALVLHRQKRFRD